ncbi:hypothetical protein LDENG_00014290 [Lucifuga dentata]|nr:hypothetical protein LDENG_00014290 [Lucifuga dentata]
MAEVIPEKSHGLKFAEQQLLRHGWKHGKGLGRGENGISEAIKVKVKCDKGGVGHKEGEQFTFHWWDHVFNKASANLQVESDQNGVKLKKTAEEDEEGMISNKKPRMATLAKSKLYGRFVKSAMLLSGQEQPELKTANTDDSSSSDDDDDEEDQRLDLSSTTKLSDADLMKACGGRTAHKGARHGLTMSAKLARLEQQEAEFMAKYCKNSRTASSSPVCVQPTNQSAEQSNERREETAEETQSNQMKRKKSAEGVHEISGDEMNTRAKKKKKKANANEDGKEMPVTENVEVSCQLTKRKHKKQRKTAEQDGEVREMIRPAAEVKRSDGTAEDSPELQAETDAKTKRKKKKKNKSSKDHAEPAADIEESNETEYNQSETDQDCPPKTKKTKEAIISEEAEVVAEHSTAKQKRKKCKEAKQTVDDEALPPKKKKKKKSKE